MDFIFKRLQSRNPDGSLQIMYTIHGNVLSPCGHLHEAANSSATGGKDLEEIELTHLDGHKGSKPVRYVGCYSVHQHVSTHGCR